MKKDIKYIIKRIIIGLGITFGVMFVKSLPVFADEINVYKNLSQSSYEEYATFETTTSPNSSFNYNWGSVPINGLNVFFGRETKAFGPLIILHEKTNDIYFLLGFNSYQDASLPNNYNYVDFLTTPVCDNCIYTRTYYNSSYTGEIELTNFYAISSKSMVNSPNSSYAWHNIKDTYNSIDFYQEVYPTYDYRSNFIRYYLDNFSDTFEVYSFTLYNKKTEFRINGKPIPIHNDNPVPTGFDKIDMFNKYAVLFYPKDFRQLPIECTKYKDGVTTDPEGNVTVIPNQICLEQSYKFTFYYAGYFNTAFTDLSVMDVVKNPVEQLTFPPTATPYELPLTMNVNKFQGGILFYNNSLSQITDPEGNVTTYYDKGFIYYNSSLFNYVIIDDYNTIPDKQISWIDKDGNTQNATIKNVPKKYQTHINEAQDTFDLFKNFKTNDHGLSSIITAPLSFIKNLSNATCTPVILPIPFSKNQNVKLPCLTTMYEEKASSVYNIYKVVITGITAYWVCVRIYALVKGFKDPNDDKIEVMEL